MLGLLLDGEPRVRDDLPEPARAAGEALVRVRVAGVCDTDLQLARGYMGFRGVPGHEMVGEVVACDDPRWLGKRVVADINAGCGACEDCTQRDGHHCANRTVLGILGRSGAFAERMTIPERCLVEVPDALDDERAVFAEPLAAALHVLDELPSSPSGARALVLGDGKLGLLIAIALATSGVATTLVGHHADKLAIAKGKGVRTLLEAELAGAPREADLVVEATGSERGFARALALVRPRGTVVLKTTVAAKLEIDLAPLVIDEIKVVGSRCGDLARAVRALAAGEIDPSPMIVARYPLARADEALAQAGRRGTLKVIVQA